MRLVFAGTPAFAAAALEALVNSKHQIDLVLTQPDRPAGRGMRMVASEVKQLALKHGLGVSQPEKLRAADVVKTIADVGADAMVVAAYGLILPLEVLNVFPYGCINIHASLLPRWRGAAPIQQALLAGDTETGISIMRMEQGLDTGPVYAMDRIPIATRDTSEKLHDKLAALGATSIVHALTGIESGSLRAEPQALEGVTYAHKITREQARIDWTLSADQLDRSARAFNPFPAAYSYFDGQVVKIWEAEVTSALTGSNPGEITDVSEAGIVVSCGRDALRLTRLQRPGGKKLAVAEFLRGFPVVRGQYFVNSVSRAE
jgi:methionyl-tRNA formyltransferase